MSDTQRDREERQHVIEVLKQMRLDYEDFWEENDTEEIKAFNYAIASIETDLKYDLLYEGVDCNNCKNNLHRGDGSTYCATGDGICHYKCEEPTTKNDLVVDWENYKDVDGNSLDDLILEVLQNNFDCGNTYGYKVADEIIELLPSVTPQEPRKGHWIEHPRTKELRFHHIYECSACKTQIIGNRYNVGNYKYCPHCGAKMVDLQEGEDKEQTDDKDNN